jgi:hypothetical protein
VRLRSRVSRLERAVPARGRCAVCRGRPAAVLRFFRQASAGQRPERRAAGGDPGEPCPGCGWTPAVTEVVEVVVTSREDVARLRGETTAG